MSASAPSVASPRYGTRRRQIVASLSAFVLALGTAVIAVPGIASAEETATVSGAVSLASSPSTPVEGVQVVLTGGPSFSFYSVYTNAAGEYLFESLPVGDYQLRVYGGTTGLLSVWWDGASTTAEADTISITAAGQAVTGIDLLMLEGGTISGVVTGPGGVPLEGVSVSAEPLDWNSEYRNATTDATGAYSLVGVSTGDYRVEFRPNSTQNIRPQYWPGVDLRSGAEFVTGIAGVGVTDISVQLPEGGMISGTVTDAVTTDPLGDISVRASRGVDVDGYSRQLSTTTAPDGTWSIVGLTPDVDWTIQFGDPFSNSALYVAEYYDAQRREADADPVRPQLGNPLTGIDATLERPATVSGRVTDSQGAGIPDTTVRFVPDGKEVSTDSNGYYEITGLAAGSYRVLVGALYDSVPTQRLEWYEDAYEPSGSAAVAIAAGETVSEFNFALTANLDPQFPNAPVITVDGAIIGVNAPTSGVPAYGVSAGLDLVRAGDGFDRTQFDVDYSWNLNGGGRGQALITAQAFGADGRGPGVRELVEYGAGPEIAVEPVILASVQDESTLALSWSIPAAGEGIDAWSWRVFPVGQPGDQAVAADYGTTSSDPFSGSAVLSELSPDIDYEFFVAGYRENGGTTYWGTRLVSTRDDGPPVDPDAPERLAGADRYATAVEISRKYLTGVPVVYLATGTNYPDALSAASAAAYLGGPLLLTTPGGLPQVVRDELVRLDPARVVVVGGTGVVSSAVRSEVTGLLPDALVSRQGGTDRYDTSRIIASLAFPANSTDTAFIATGANFPDALSASAAAGAVGAPVLLVNGSGASVDSDTIELMLDLGVENVVIAGGSGAVSVAVENELRSNFGPAFVTRLSGADRYLTAVEINRLRFSSADTVFLATGLGYADALAGAALAGREAGPLFVTPRNCVPGAVLLEIERLAPSKIVLLGGTAVLTNEVASLTRC